MIKELEMLTRISRWFHLWARGWIILALFATLVVYVAITLPILQAAPGGSIVSLDARLFYTPEEAFSTVGSYGDASSFWIRIYLTWDVVNPILYTMAFSLLISWLFQRSFKPGSRMQQLNVLPVGAGIFDLLENISIVTLLATYPDQLTIVAWLGTLFTTTKMGFLAVSTLLISFGVVSAAANKLKEQ
ncbi:MAG: hypothetical protein GTO14_09335 [Anaerolineales bacterium]|nr:hypothetical protein [Anaerolineales bacterium]